MCTCLSWHNQNEIFYLKCWIIYSMFYFNKIRLCYDLINMMTNCHFDSRFKKLRRNHIGFVFKIFLLAPKLTKKIKGVEILGRTPCTSRSNGHGSPSLHPLGRSAVFYFTFISREPTLFHICRLHLTFAPHASFQYTIFHSILSSFAFYRSRSSHPSVNVFQKATEVERA